MTIGVKRKRVPQDEDSYLSDESDFYGGEATKFDFEARARDFSVASWWEYHQPSLTEIAHRNISTKKHKYENKLYNSYEGIPCARQLTETVEAFLQRLPPATTPVSHSLPWIYICNPYRKMAMVVDSGHGVEEGPLGEDEDRDGFIEQGQELLRDLRVIRKQIENQKPNAAKGTIARAVNPQKEIIVKKILEAAVEYNCTSGKWMLFCESSEVNHVWSVIARYTANNELGVCAKVAPAPENGEDRKPRLICVYTKDFTEVKDVSRVVQKLKDLGLIDMRGRGIYYKADAFTHLGLNSDNEYGIKMSMYKSADVLKSSPGQAKYTKPERHFSHLVKENDEDAWEL